MGHQAHNKSNPIENKRAGGLSFEGRWLLAVLESHVTRQSSFSLVSQAAIRIEIYTISLERERNTSYWLENCGGFPYSGFSSAFLVSKGPHTRGD